MKVALSFPLKANKKKGVVEFESLLKASNRDIYDANINLAVNILRRTNYLTFGLMSLVYKSVNKL